MDSEAPQEGEKLEEMLLRKGLLMPVGQIIEGLQQTALTYNLPMGDIRMNYSTRLLQELGLWAQEQGRGAEFQTEGFRVYFVDNENVCDSDRLIEIVRRAGLNPEEAKRVLETRQYSSAVDADWEVVAAREIVAAPTFIVGDDRLVGAQSYENLAKFVVQHGAKNKLPMNSAEQ